MKLLLQHRILLGYIILIVVIGTMEGTRHTVFVWTAYFNV